MTTECACPSVEELRAYQAGRLAETLASVVVTHLDGCPRCQATLEGLPEPALLLNLSSVLADQGAVSSHTKSPRADRGSPTPAADPVAVFADHPDFRLREVAGRGGFGVVYKARQFRPERDVAVKVLLAGGPASPEVAIRFREAAKRALPHPQVVPVYEAGTHHGLPYLVMPWLDGGTLADRLDGLWRRREEARPASSPPLAARREAVRVLASVARTVHFLHQHGVLHRDIKPSNVLFDAEGQPYVTDFDLAKSLTGPSGLTDPGVCMGTPLYMAPEVAQGGAHAATTSADTYSLGVMLFETLTGCTPFVGDDRTALLKQVSETPVPAPRALCADVDADLETVCLKCLAKHPDERYATSADFADDLERWLRGEPVRARRTGPMLRAWYWARRNPLAAVLLGLVAVSVVAALAGFAGWAVEQGRRLTAERQQHEEAEATAHRERVAAARAAASRGDWENALAFYDAAIADDRDDQLLLRVEKLRGWLPFNRRAPLLAELGALTARADLGEHAAAVQLLQADLLMSNPATQAEGLRLVEAALAAGALSPADRAFAQGLAAATAVESLERFEAVLDVEPFNHRAHVATISGLLFLGRFDQAREQIRLMRKFFPYDPVPSLAELWSDLLEGKKWSEVEPKLDALGRLPGMQAATELRSFFRQVHDGYSKINQPGGLTYLEVMGHRKILEKLDEQVQAFHGQGGFGQFGLYVPVYRWQVGDWPGLGRDLLEFFAEAAAQRAGPAAERLLKAGGQSQDALALWAAGSAQLVIAIGAGEKMTEEAQKGAELLYRAAATPTPIRWIRPRALLIAAFIESTALQTKPELRTPERIKRVEDTLRTLPLEGWTTPAERRQLFTGVVPHIHPELARILLAEWRRLDPKETLPLRVQAERELSDGNHLAALRLADELLARKTHVKEMQQVRVAALAGLRKVLEETAPK